jgi:hypothetical protein
MARREGPGTRVAGAILLAAGRGLTTIKFDPLVDLLRGDPRYKALLRKLKLPE